MLVCFSLAHDCIINHQSTYIRLLSQKAETLAEMHKLLLLLQCLHRHRILFLTKPQQARFGGTSHET